MAQDLHGAVRRRHLDLQEKLIGGLAVLGGLYSVRRIFPVSRKYVLAIY